MSINKLSLWMGQVFSWSFLLMTVLTFAIVVLRYVFQLGWVWLQEAVVYIHAFSFLSLAGYTLLTEKHVRVDVLYQRYSQKTKAYIDLFGGIFLLCPFLYVIFTKSWPYILSSWRVLEKSGDAGGLPLVFLLKTMIFIFCITLFLQGLGASLTAVKRLIRD